MPRYQKPIARVSYAEHASRQAHRAVPDDPDDAGRLAGEATRIEPLQKIQVAFDQLVSYFDLRRSGAIDPYGTSPGQHAAAVLAHARRHAVTLRVAADAAASMIQQMLSQVETTVMADQKPTEGTPEDPPKLTDSGEPHPLQSGGYDPDADPQLPAVSDIEALKEGKTTRKQAEALNAAAQDQERTDPAPEGVPGPEAPPADPPKPAKPSKGK